MSVIVSRNVRSDKLMSPAEAAYIAGLLDGEGTVCLAARKDKDCRNHFFYPRVQISNTSLDLLDRVLEITGNGYVTRSSSPEGQKPGYVWKIGARQARYILPQVLPYLVLKRRQAEIVIQQGELLEEDRRCRRSDTRLAILALYNECRNLNKRGLVIGQEAAWEDLERKPETPKFCQHEGCTKRIYMEHPYCYEHWLEQREPYHKFCEHCSEVFDAILPHTRFCSEKCQRRHRWETVVKPQEKLNKPQRKLCPGCSQYFETDRKNKEFCGRYCLNKMGRARERAKKAGLPVPERITEFVMPSEVYRDRQCAFCNQTFETNNSRRIFCSAKCSNAAQRVKHTAKHREEMGNREFKPCPICGTPVDRTKNSRRTYCSLKCNTKAQNDKKRTK